MSWSGAKRLLGVRVLSAESFRAVTVWSLLDVSIRHRLLVSWAFSCCEFFSVVRSCLLGVVLWSHFDRLPMSIGCRCICQGLVCKLAFRCLVFCDVVSYSDAGRCYGLLRLEIYILSGSLVRGLCRCCCLRLLSLMIWSALDCKVPSK